VIERIQSKILREIRKRSRRGVPFQEQTTYIERDSNWYEPLLAGPSTLMEECRSAETVAEVVKVLDLLTPDRFIEFNVAYYQAALKRFGARWKYADILTVLLGLSKQLRIQSYLEIGVRRGRSLAMVAAMHPEVSIVGFDKWIQDYAGIENPGPEFVRSELQRVGYRGRLVLVSGDSRATVPGYVREHPDAFFDLVTVDGDHSVRGATADLRAVIPRLKIGGVLVFDDICNPYHPRLRQVWERYVARSRRFVSVAFDELGYGVGFAIRKY